MADRKHYIDKLSAQLRQWDAEIDKLEARADEVSADAKVEYQKQIEKLQSKMQEAKARIKGIKEAGEDAWEELKAGTEEAFSIMNDALSNAISKLK